MPPLTTVRVDVVGLQETDLQVMQNGRLMEIAEGREVIFTHQDVGVPQEGQLLALGINGVFLNLNRRNKTQKAGDEASSLHPILALLAGTTILA